MPVDRAAFRPPITPAGWQFMARELEEMAAQIVKGKTLTTDDAVDLDNIAVLMRMHADYQGVSQ